MGDPDPFVTAMEAYREAFGAGALPHLFAMQPDRLDAVAKAMDAAVLRGRPLTDAEVTALTGISPPPPGALS